MIGRTNNEEGKSKADVSRLPYHSFLLRFFAPPRPPIILIFKFFFFLSVPRVPKTNHTIIRQANKRKSRYPQTSSYPQPEKIERQDNGGIYVCLGKGIGLS
jgi:hypothetical protein